MTKIITKKIGTTNWKIIYPDDISAELENSANLGYHVSDWAWQHAYCIGINLKNNKEKWLPKNYIDMLLEENARENFMNIYYDPKFEALITKTELHRDFDECWAQLRTRKEKEDFAINCCYYKDDGKCKIYFHVFDLDANHYNDIELEDYRNRNRRSFKMWNSIDGGNC